MSSQTLSQPTSTSTSSSASAIASVTGRRRVPPAVNEPVRSYAPGTPERAELKARLASMATERVEIPVVIGGKRITTGDTAQSVMPHDHGHVLADYHQATPQLVQQAIAAATEAQREWANWPWEDRAAVFLKAAELLASTWRSTINAATMLGQSKTVHQSEIDAACELIDFWRWNVQYAQEIYDEQPISDRGMWNQLDYRPLEGFVYAVSPFNFTAIGGNLSGAPALMGNSVVWKPASSAMLSAWYVFRVLEEAGLPPGVINFVPGNAADISNAVLSHRDLAGVHFTGSTSVFNNMWKTIGENMSRYRSYPRIVGETGGKDFIVAHPSADPVAVAVGMARGAYEYQGQKCSAASRAYIPQSMWKEVRERCVEIINSIKMGDVRDFRNFMGAVIDKRAFDKISEYIAEAKKSATIVAGGNGRRLEGLLHLADPGRDEGPGLQTPLRGDLRTGADRPRLPGRKVERDAADRRSHLPLRPDRRRLRARTHRASRSHARPAPGGRQLLSERQAHRRRRRPAAIRRRARVGHERQGRFEIEPAAVGQRPHDQGNVRAAHGSPLPVHGRGIDTHGRR